MILLYKDQTIPDPPLYENKYFQQQPDYVKKGLNKIRWYWRFDSPEKYQNMVKGYYRMISGVDMALGRLLAELKKLRNLSLAGTAGCDLSPLRGLPPRTLDISRCNADFSVLLEFTELRDLKAISARFDSAQQSVLNQLQARGVNVHT